MVRMLPVHLEMREEPGRQHKVERPTTRDLVGDVDLAAAGVTDRGITPLIVPHRRALAGGRSNRRMVGRLGGHRTRQQMERLVAGSRGGSTPATSSRRRSGRPSRRRSSAGVPAGARPGRATAEPVPRPPSCGGDVRAVPGVHARGREEPARALVDRADVEHLRACAGAAAAAGGEGDGRGAGIGASNLASLRPVATRARHDRHADFFEDQRRSATTPATKSCWMMSRPVGPMNRAGRNGGQPWLSPTRNVSTGR